MSFSEILQSFKDFFSRALDSLAFLGKTYKKTSLVIVCVLGVSFMWWARSGFTFDLFRSQAAPGDPPVKTATWSYCDYATNSCQSAPASLVQEARTALGVPLTDYSAPSCTTVGTACTPGSAPDVCRPWQGSSATSWVPTNSPANVPACQPLSKISAAEFPGFTDPMPVPPGITFPDCFAITDKSSADPNWGTVTENTIPTILQDNSTAKLFMRATVVNNCPWTVHFTMQVDGSKKASFDQGAGKRNIGLSAAETAKAFTTNMPSGFDFPSCWNSGGPRPVECARDIRIEFNLNTYTCGSLGISTSWWHRTQGNATGGANAQATTSGPLNYATVLNYGRDCIGSPIERAPGNGGGSGTGTPTTCPAIPQQTQVRPATVNVQCGVSQNILTWQNPLSLNAAVNTVLRSTNGANAVTLWGEGGCWNTFGIGTFTDRNIISGTTYTYRVKTHPNVSSNEVSCRNGVRVTPSPTTSPGVTPTPGATPTPAVTPTPFITLGPTATLSPTNHLACVNNACVLVAGSGANTCTTNASCGTGSTPTPTSVVNQSDNDLDDDGISNTQECPGYTVGAGIAGCPDTDGDGVADILDIDSNNDGIADGPTGGPGTVPTGPGDTTLLALIVSAIVSLAYVSYTHSPGGKRREAQSISEDQGPMDFRN